jgi:hypothetical protein
MGKYNERVWGKHIRGCLFFAPHPSLFLFFLNQEDSLNGFSFVTRPPPAANFVKEFPNHTEFPRQRPPHITLRAFSIVVCRASQGL